MAISEFESRRSFGDRLKGAGRRVKGSMSGSLRVARNGVAKLSERAPGTWSATQAGARRTTIALQKLPDTTLRSMAASTAGVGAGLYLAGKRRLGILAGVIPAAVMGAAIALRPAKPVVPVEPRP